jgi:hypothetical protein
VGADLMPEYAWSAPAVRLWRKRVYWAYSPVITPPVYRIAAP